LGLVISGHGKKFNVRAVNRDYTCEIRGKIKFATKSITPVAVGDEVEIATRDDGSGMIEKVLPRKSMFVRPSKASDKKRQVIAANIDQLAAVVSVKSPPLKPGLIDRALIAAQIGHLRPIIVINKIDLGKIPILDELEQDYRRIQVPLFIVSAVTGEGLDTLEQALIDFKTIMAGHSGVGKSTLLNRLIPGLNLKVSDISEATDKGVHTTTHVELFALPRGGFVLDSPGLKVLGLWELQKEDLQWHYPEMEAYLNDCRFTGCSHLQEPDCAVKAAVKEGKISRIRYDNYQTIYSSLES
jgi:ribosome biogenesis GTPase